MKRIYFSIFIIGLCSYTGAQPILYPHNYIINNTVLGNNSSPFYYPTKIISPGASGAATISDAEDIEFVAGEEVILKDGFDAENFSSGQFVARTEPIQLYVLESPYVSIDNNNVVHVKKWEKFECAFALPKEYEDAIDNFFDHYYYGTNNTPQLNPYADDSLEITVTFFQANNTCTKKCFFMRQGNWCGNGDSHDQLCDYDSLTHPLGKYNWHFRFAPDEVNNGSTFRINISTPLLANPLPSYQFNGFDFNCDNPEPDNKGYVRRNPNNSRYLKFDYNDEPFFGIGENLGDLRHGGYYDTGGSYDWPHFYRLDFDNVVRTMDELNSAGANYVRLMMFKHMYDIEWSNLGVYDNFGISTVCGFNNPPGNHQYQLWILDSIFDRARDKGIYFQLDINHFTPGNGFENWGWGNNAYVRKFTDYVNYSGPPGEFNDFDKYFYDVSYTPGDYHNPFYWWKRHYDYLIARYGYSTNMIAYEFFNEVDGTLRYKDYIPSALCNTGTSLVTA